MFFGVRAYLGASALVWRLAPLLRLAGLFGSFCALSHALLQFFGLRAAYFGASARCRTLCPSSSAYGLFFGTFAAFVRLPCPLPVFELMRRRIGGVCRGYPLRRFSSLFRPLFRVSERGWQLRSGRLRLSACGVLPSFGAEKAARRGLRHAERPRKPLKRLSYACFTCGTAPSARGRSVTFPLRRIWVSGSPNR